MVLRRTFTDWYCNERAAKFREKHLPYGGTQTDILRKRKIMGSEMLKNRTIDNCDTNFCVFIAVATMSLQNRTTDVALVD